MQVNITQSFHSLLDLIPMEVNTIYNVDCLSVKEFCISTTNVRGKQTNIPLNRFLYALRDEKRPEIILLFVYDHLKFRIYHETVKLTTEQDAAEALEKLKSITTGRRVKNRMFAFVNPSSGQGKGVEVFEKSVKFHLNRADIEIDNQITEKEGENSLEGIAERLDVNLYDALLIVGGDSSLRDVLNSLWTKAGKPDVQSKDFILPVFAIIPVGTGNELAVNWYGSSSLDSAITAVLLGESTKLQLLQLQSKAGKSGPAINKLGAVCVAYGVTLEALERTAGKNYPLPVKLMYGFGGSFIWHAEPFRAMVKVTATDSEDNIEVDLKLRDLMVLSNDMNLGKQTPQSSPGSLFVVEATSGKVKFIQQYAAAISRLYKRQSLQRGHSTSGIRQCYAGIVKKVHIRIPEVDNQKQKKATINVDGDLFDCELNFQVDVHPECLPACVIDRSNFD